MVAYPDRHLGYGTKMEQQFKIITLDIARKGALNHISKIVEEGLSENIFLYKIRNKGVSDSAYPDMCVPVAGLLDYYSETKNCEFISAKNLKSTYLYKTSFINPKIYSGEDVEKDNFLDSVWKFSFCDNHHIVSGIVNTIRAKALVAEGVLLSIELALNEIMDNVLNHSVGTNGSPEEALGYVMAQFHYEKGVIAVSVHDNGQGILKSFNDPESNYSPFSEENAIEISTEKDITSGNGAGRGLWMVRELIRENKGNLEIMSGGTRYRIDYKGDEFNSVFSGIKNIVDGGTTISFRINSLESINIEKALDGYVPTDLWLENHELDERTLLFSIKDESNGAGTRYAARKVRNKIINAFRENKTKVVIDFKDVSLVSSSYADKLIGKLVDEIGFVRFFSMFSLSNVSQFNELMINESLKRHFSL